MGKSRMAIDPEKLGFSTASLPGHSLAEATAVGKRLGFQTCEMLGFANFRHSQGQLDGFSFERMSEVEREKLRAMASQFRHVSTHAPFFDVIPFSPNETLAEVSRQQMLTAVEAAAYIGGETTTMHFKPRNTWEFEDYRDEVVDFYRAVGDYAGERGVTVTLETGFPQPPEELERLIWDIDHAAVGVNVDFGHLPKPDAQLAGTAEGAEAYNAALERHIRALGEKVYHMHLVDVRLSDFRDHRAPGRGFLDYERIFKAAADSGFSGLYVLELEEADMEQALEAGRARVRAAVERVNELAGGE